MDWKTIKSFKKSKADALQVIKAKVLGTCVIKEEVKPYTFK